ncbi:MAG: hypothetical protein Tsb006_3720 [Rickettsiaceae bacterium]
MNKSKLLATAFAVAALSFTSAQADNHEGMEKCKIEGAKTETFVEVPAGECEKVNKGDFSGVSEEVKAQIDASMMEN